VIGLSAILTESDWASFAHLVTLSVRGPDWSGFSIRHPPGCARLDDGWKCEFTDAIDSVFFYADIRAAVDADLTPIFPGGW